MNLVLEHVPQPAQLGLAVLGTLRRRPGGEIVLPEMSAQSAGQRFDGRRLEAYRQICGFVEEGDVPITYPQVSAIALQMYLLTRPQFPLPLMGLVHLRNRIEQERPLDPEAAYTLTVAVAASRATPKGLEFDLETRYAAEDGATPWRAVATVLYRNRKPPPKKPAPEAPPLPAARYVAFEAPADIGRRYGRISGDNNPIHLHPWSAKLFGYTRHIAHGMWSLARCAALLREPLGRAPRELQAQFRQPLFLPGRVSLRHVAEGQGIGFALLGRDSGKLHLTGTVR